jgi:DNA topoisomerase-3
MCTIQNSAHQRIYLEVPFDEKDEVKSLGASWDSTRKQWYTIPGDGALDFAKWNQQRVYLDVPFEEKDEVKALGARWSSHRQQWYTMAGGDMSQFARWPVSQEDDSEFERVYFSVPFDEKHEVKEMGGRWDSERKLWFIIAGSDHIHSAKWPVVSGDQSERIYLNVPFDDKDEVKALGGRWDPESKEWYVMDHADMSQVSKWRR